MMELHLNGVAVDCVIGERPDERTRLQRLRIDAVLHLDAAAAATDELADTVDYAELAEGIRAVLVDAKCKMIERAASLAAECCLADARVTSVEVTVMKAGAIPGLESAAVRYCCKHEREDHKPQ